MILEEEEVKEGEYQQTTQPCPGLHDKILPLLQPLQADIYAFQVGLAKSF